MSGYDYLAVAGEAECPYCGSREKIKVSEAEEAGRECMNCFCWCEVWRRAPGEYELYKAESTEGETNADNF